MTYLDIVVRLLHASSSRPAHALAFAVSYIHSGPVSILSRTARLIVWGPYARALDCFLSRRPGPNNFYSKLKRELFVDEIVLAPSLE